MLIVIPADHEAIDDTRGLVETIVEINKLRHAELRNRAREGADLVSPILTALAMLSCVLVFVIMANLSLSKRDQRGGGFWGESGDRAAEG